MIRSYLYINEAINERFEEEIPFKTLYYNENLYLSYTYIGH